MSTASPPPPGIEPPGIIADLARLNVRYLLEHRQLGVLRAAVALPLPPQAYSEQNEAPHLITYTLGGVLREIAPQKRRTITLNGASGYDARTGHTRDGLITAQPGPVLLAEFQAFIEQYLEQCASDGAQVATPTHKLEPNHELIFRAVDENTHYKVEVIALRIDRDTNINHFSRGWTLTLEAYDTAEAPPSAFGAYTDTLAAITNAIDTAAAYAAVGAQAIQGVNSLARLTLGPINALRNLTAALGEAMEGISSLAALPRDLIRAASFAVGEVRRDFTRLANDLERFPSATGAAWGALTTALLGADEAQAQIESVSALIPQRVDLEPQTAAPLSPAPASTSTPSAAAIPYYLRLGETLEHLAARVLGSAARWTEIAELNGWIDAETLGSGRPARAGDLVLIPLNTNAQPEPARERDAYGTDLALDQNGDLQLKGADLATISGAANVEQALGLRLKTTALELAWAPRYGLPALTGTRLTATSAGYVGALVREQVEADARIERALLIEARDAGDALAVHLEARTTAGAFLQTTIEAPR
jgi:hypothetical protein